MTDYYDDEYACISCGGFCNDGGVCNDCLDSVDLDEYEERRRNWLAEQQDELWE